jgi:hypothetical protein
VVQGSLMAFTLISTSFLSKRGFYLLRPHNARLDGVGGVRRRRGKHQIQKPKPLPVRSSLIRCAILHAILNRTLQVEHQFYSAVMVAAP